MSAKAENLSAHAVFEGFVTARYHRSMKFSKSRLVRRWAIAMLPLLLLGCMNLPMLQGRSVTFATTDTEGTRLGAAIIARAAAHTGKSGIRELADPHEAFAARVLLAEAAERSLDVQYYIWHGDQTGYLLFESLWNAAERGVRVRLLLDDNNTGGLDTSIAALDAHSNIEVRLYNPLAQRELRFLNFLTDFTRVNRRMHNKSFTADNQITIVGGRNVGNAYFGAGDGVQFADLDVIAVGPAVHEVSTVFDLFWNSASAYPAASLLGSPGDDASAVLRDKFEQVRADPKAQTYLQSLLDAPQVREMLSGSLLLEWADTRVLSDDPAKTLDTSEHPDGLLLTDLLESIGQPEHSFDLVSPYFVPGRKGTAALSALAERGVKVRVLTNSLSATDVGAVHAGYAKRRAALLRAGVQLYELKRSGGGAVPEAKSRFVGRSAASLHAKTFAVDGKRLFVGSFNFDPRSARLNTEMGLIIDSPVLADKLTRFFDSKVPTLSYEVRLNAKEGELEWIERTANGQTSQTSEPGTNWLQHAFIGLLSILPIEWML